MISPTLFIALGGTGREIPLRLRRHILAHAWGTADNPVNVDNLTEFPIAQFIYFDLDHAGEYRRDMESVKFGDEEKVDRKLNLDKYFRRRDTSLPSRIQTIQGSDRWEEQRPF